MKPEDETRALACKACQRAGLDTTSIEPVRIAENAIWRLPQAGIIVRVPPPGREQASARELAIAGWFAAHGISAVRPAPEIAQPIEEQGRAVTFWVELPPHRPGTVMDVVRLLKQLHDLPKPGFDIGTLQPFVRVAERIDTAMYLARDDLVFLKSLHDDLQQAWKQLPDGLPEAVIHGDAWIGNCVVDDHGTPYLLDLERCSIGRPEWDLASTAFKRTTTAGISANEYQTFCEAYGYDVTVWAGYDTLRAIRELRVTSWAAQVAAQRTEWRGEVQHRVDCLRGKQGPRPWIWTAVG